MVVRERFTKLGACLLAALVLNLAWVVPAFAEAADGVDGDGDELLLPLAIGAAIIIGGLVYWQSRRARTRADGRERGPR